MRLSLCSAVSTKLTAFVGLVTGCIMFSCGLGVSCMEFSCVQRPLHTLCIHLPLSPPSHLIFPLLTPANSTDTPA